MNDKDINGEKIISVILNSVTSYQNITYFNYWEAFLPLCTILILSHKCWEKPIYGLLPTFLNQT
ncbi:hypothetical protein [Spiroplasma ixodetis]|uniref:Uncharacterized protein n=1 Tax=Spiroplasma ixodetis TaxID=2141 RepID=A0ABM8BWI4_9MOLU|nr:hypothetical protein [Spiroplasma ixodetis]BDT04236.1 hypothetical protein SHM_18820 [Spiroplasma ixodetis]